MPQGLYCSLGRQLRPKHNPCKAAKALPVSAGALLSPGRLGGRPGPGNRAEAAAHAEGSGSPGQRLPLLGPLPLLRLLLPALLLLPLLLQLLKFLPLQLPLLDGGIAQVFGGIERNL